MEQRARLTPLGDRRQVSHVHTGARSLSGQAGPDRSQFTCDQGEDNMLLSILLISIFHHTTLSQYEVVRRDPFRYVSPSLLIHSDTALDWDSLNLSCPPGTKVILSQKLSMEIWKIFIVTF